MSHIVDSCPLTKLNGNLSQLYSADGEVIAWPIIHEESIASAVHTLHCGLTRMTFGSCSCQERITNSVIGVARPLVPDYGTTFHLITVAGTYL